MHACYQGCVLRQLPLSTPLLLSLKSPASVNMGMPAIHTHVCLEVHVHQGMCMNARVHVRMSVNMYVFSRCACVCTLGYSVRKEEHSPHIHVRKRCIRYLRCHMYTACSLCVVRLQTCMHGLALWCFTWPRLPDPYRAPATPPAKLTPRAGVP